MNGDRTRKEFLVQSISGAVALGLLGTGRPAGQAYAQGKPSEPLQVLSEDQAAVYDAWCDVLVIGASQAGVTRFVDKYLASPYAETLLFLKYFENVPLDAFYLLGIAGINEESNAQYAKSFLALTDEERRSIVEAAATSSTRVWRDPDPSLFYFVSRADAVDVVYGTVAGFRSLGVSYLAHIRPPYPW